MSPIFRYGAVVVSILTLAAARPSGANDLTITSVTLTGQNSTTNTIQVQFDVSWKNSWRVTGADPINYDAVWLFVKYRRGTGAWQHATMSPSGHVPSGGLTGALSDGAGVFVYRNADGSGDISATSVQLRWAYGLDGLVDNEPDVEVRVFGIEMVYVPQGPFAVGDGASLNSFDLTTITTADATVVPSGSSGLLGSPTGGHPANETPPTNASWPNGFDAYFVMKYELTQAQYVDFLNLLTFDQQDWRVEADLTSPAGTRINLPTTTGRNGIEIVVPGSVGVPAVFGHDLSDNGVYNESDDGQSLPNGYMSWDDGAAYADWAGLRPMSELEYEKAGRGPLAPVAGEYAWGSPSIHSTVYAVTSPGADGESVSNPGAGVGNAHYVDTKVGNYPLRSGIFAASTVTPTRAEAGASYYGIAELTGNLVEPVVDISTSGAVVETHGDGVLTASGFADAGFTTQSGSGERGGSVVQAATLLPISARLPGGGFGGTIVDPREWDLGFRLVRTAP